MNLSNSEQLDMENLQVVQGTPTPRVYVPAWPISTSPLSTSRSMMGLHQPDTLPNHSPWSAPAQSPRVLFGTANLDCNPATFFHPTAAPSSIALDVPQSSLPPMPSWPPVPSMNCESSPSHPVSRPISLPGSQPHTPRQPQPPPQAVLCPVTLPRTQSAGTDQFAQVQPGHWENGQAGGRVGALPAGVAYSTVVDGPKYDFAPPATVALPSPSAMPPTVRVVTRIVSTPMYDFEDSQPLVRHVGETWPQEPAHSNGVMLSSRGFDVSSTSLLREDNLDVIDPSSGAKVLKTNEDLRKLRETLQTVTGLRSESREALLASFDKVFGDQEFRPADASFSKMQ